MSSSRRNSGSKGSWGVLLLLVAVWGVLVLVCGIAVLYALDRRTAAPIVYETAPSPEEDERPTNDATPNDLAQYIESIDDMEPVVKTVDHQPVTTPYIVSIGRSPIPQPGEGFDEPTKADRIPDTRAKTEPPDPNHWIPWNQAQHHVGEHLTVKGKVVQTHNTGQACFLNFDTDSRGKFYVIIFRQVLDSWDQPPEVYFRDKIIIVSGPISMYNERYQIAVRDPKQIIALD